MKQEEHIIKLNYALTNKLRQLLENNELKIQVGSEKYEIDKIDNLRCYTTAELSAEELFTRENVIDFDGDLSAMIKTKDNGSSRKWLSCLCQKTIVKYNLDTREFDIINGPEVVIWSK